MTTMMKMRATVATLDKKEHELAPHQYRSGAHQSSNVLKHAVIASAKTQPGSLWRTRVVVLKASPWHGERHKRTTFKVAAENRFFNCGTRFINK